MAEDEGGKGAGKTDPRADWFVGRVTTA